MDGVWKAFIVVMEVASGNPVDQLVRFDNFKTEKECALQVARDDAEGVFEELQSQLDAVFGPGKMKLVDPGCKFVGKDV